MLVQGVVAAILEALRTSAVRPGEFFMEDIGKHYLNIQELGISFFSWISRLQIVLVKGLEWLYRSYHLLLKESWAFVQSEVVETFRCWAQKRYLSPLFATDIRSADLWEAGNICCEAYNWCNW